MSKKVLFFTDAGIDDAIALIMALFSEKIEVVGIVADYGNISKDVATKNIEYLTEIAKKKPIPIFHGADYPLTSNTPHFYPDVHGIHGLGPIIPEGNFHTGQLKSFFAIINMIEKYKDELIIVNVGRLTSLSILFILYKEIMKTVKSYYIMGGAFLHPGNVTPIAEANFHEDPVAANLVFKYASNVSVYPLNVTQYALVTPEMINYIDEIGKSKLVKPMLDHYYYQFYKKLFPTLEGAPVHDLMPLMAIIDDTMFTYHHSPIYVINSDLARGQSYAEFRSSIQEKPFINRPIQRIAIDFDYNRFFKYFMTIMTDRQFS
ncbi:nucleoside hydrolase [Bacillus hominis]|uniref:nucleoside hydrolase n=1 Tax=Bacillus hominis TaxID=2817478 RepID=UPI001BB44DA1|nr:nucleoside hydrolase [Bacillus hominis]